MFWISPVRMLMNKGECSHMLISAVQISSSLSLSLSLSLYPLLSSLSSLEVFLQEFKSTIDYLHVLLCTFRGQACHF